MFHTVASSVEESILIVPSAPSSSFSPPLCDDFQIAVLINPVEYQKHKVLHTISTIIPFNIHLSLKNYIS
jgi:hypothetical protein